MKEYEIFLYGDIDPNVTTETEQFIEHHKNQKNYRKKYKCFTMTYVMDTTTVTEKNAEQ